MTLAETQRLEKSVLLQFVAYNLNQTLDTALGFFLQEDEYRKRETASNLAQYRSEVQRFVKQVDEQQGSFHGVKETKANLQRKLAEVEEAATPYLSTDTS